MSSPLASAVVSVSYAVVDGFPPGSVVDHILVTCVGASTGAQPSQTVPPGTTTATFTALAPDTYTFTAQGFPAAGAGFGTAVSTTLTVTAPATVSLNLPSTLSAAQS